MAGFVLNDFGLRMESPKSSEQKWYCVRSQPRQEHVAAAHLQRLMEIEVFCPRIRFKKCSRGGGALSVTQALFPGYLFAKFRFDLEHRMVRYAHGVRGLVHFGEKYPSLPDGLIASLRSGIGDEPVKELSRPLSEGMPVTIVQGSFRGFTAVITGLRSSAERVRVLLDFLGRTVEAELPCELVLPALPHPLVPVN